jgi:hypothetical protein
MLLTDSPVDPAAARRARTARLPRRPGLVVGGAGRGTDEGGRRVAAGARN